MARRVSRHSSLNMITRALASASEVPNEQGRGEPQQGRDQDQEKPGRDAAEIGAGIGQSAADQRPADPRKILLGVVAQQRTPAAVRHDEEPYPGDLSIGGESEPRERMLIPDGRAGQRRR
jgi:hypothetical protein